MHFAWTTWRLGSGGADGEWTDLGYDLDGFKYEATSFPHCKPPNFAKTTRVVQDGPLGQDDSFGRNFMPSVLVFAVDTPKRTNKDAARGLRTFVLTLDALGPEPNQLGVTGRLRRADGDGTAGPDISSFGWAVAEPGTELTGYVRDGTLVLRGGRAFVRMRAGDPTWWIPVQSVLLTGQIEGTKLKGGRMSGVVRTVDLMASLEALFSSYKTCISTAEYFMGDASLTADLPLDGNHDPDRVCDGTSFALGFDAASSKVAAEIESPVPVLHRCDGSTIDGFGGP